MRRSKSVLAAVIVAVLALPTVTTANTPPPCPAAWEPPDTSVSWETISASLEADAVEMRWGDCFFSGVGPSFVSSDPGDPEYRTLEIEWLEQGAGARLNIYFAADETDWWVTEIRTPAGEFHDHDSMPYDLGEMFRTPRGESFEGDVRLPHPGGGELVIHGLRLTAFTPGTGPGPLVDCGPAVTARKDVRKDPLQKGQPLHGSGIRKMTPEVAEALLRERGYCFTFRYDGGRWCTAPPGGKVQDLAYLPDGEVVVFVHDDEPHPYEEVPPEGRGCPAG